MVLKKIAIAFVMLLGISLTQSTRYYPPLWNPDTTLQEALTQLGRQEPTHYQYHVSSMQVQQGKDFVHFGRTIDEFGKKTNYISKHFVCTHCHNVVQEDPDLSSRDPEERLEFAISQNLPFLQGTTFHGIVNRKSWYNDDYEKKYGEKVKAANKDLKKAIQLCAIECSQGRELQEWEIEAILAYFWTLQVKLGDLNLQSEDYLAFNQQRFRSVSHSQIESKLDSLFLPYSPATFGSAPADKNEGYEYTGDPERGAFIYELSCLHCHKKGGASRYELDYSTVSFRHLKNKIPDDSHFSLYQIIRYGTYAIPGHRPYMPHYPLERMSHQQVEDLRAYIELMSF